jgi:hypothetical protein
MDSARRLFLAAANNEVRFLPGVCSTLRVVTLALLSGQVESDLNLVETLPRLLCAILGDKRSDIDRAAVRGHAPVVTSAGLAAKIEF